ncbi:MAG: FGGY-family carbohydrate kinase, partial [Planctomycetota bacterium]
MSLLGIDVGTTGCKAAAFTESGECLASAYREYATLHPQPGWAELDSRDVWGRVEAVIAEVAAQSTRDPITALCTSSMGEAMVPVTMEREILRHCILCADTRGEDYIEELKRSIRQEEFYEINPNILGPSYSLPSLLWLRDHEPDLYERTDRFLLWGDMVGFMLGGEPLTSYSHANRTLLFDIRAEDWSDQLLELSGIERAKLGTTAPGGFVSGKVADGVARRLGLPLDVSVVVGGHDQCCNSLGAGIYSAGRAVCGIGSFECITPTYDHIPDSGPMLANGLNVEHHVLPGLYVSFIYNQAGTLVKWFRDVFAGADQQLVGEDVDIYDVLAEEMPEGPTRLLMLPYFETTGPPDFISDAKGAIVGLRTGTTRGEILKSIMECVTFY